MSKLKQHDAGMDFGFYASIPRIVRTEYPEISPAQKWLYVCLKDLAGDDGTCYRTIRALAKETDLSCGLISESIPVLHTAGLIHAEKKKRQIGGKEVWHIRIVDIWQKNGEVYPTRRSSGEQRDSAPDVRDVNVQIVSNPLEACLPAECSSAEPEERTASRPGSKNKSEGRTERVMRSIQSAAPDSLSASSYVPVRASDGQRIIQLDEHRTRGGEAAARVAVGNNLVASAHVYRPESDGVGRVSDEHTAKMPELSTTSATYPHRSGKTTSRRSAQGIRSQVFQTKLEAALSEEGRAIYTAWCSLFKVPMPLTPATAKAAEELVKPLAVWCPALDKTPTELLKEIMRWLYATDKTGYYQRGVKLYDISREFEGWQSAKEREMRTQDEDAAPSPQTSKVFWQGQWMSYEEADARGWNGGFGEFVQHIIYAQAK